MLKKLLCMALALLMLVSIIACGGNDVVDTDADGENNTIDTDSIEDPIDPQLEAIDGGKMELHFLAREPGLTANYWYEETISENNGIANVVDAAVFKRNTFVEEKYNIKISRTAINYNQISDTINIQVNSMAEDADSYHIALPMLTHAFNMTKNGYNYAIDELEFIDPSKPYWRSDIYDATTIKGKNYFISGDINTSVYGSSWTTFFNEEIVKNNKIENPYDLVKKGQWTIDKMLELSKNFGGDGGDGVYDNSDDYAICSGNWVWQCLFYGADLRFVDKDANDMPYVVCKDMGKREIIQDVLTRIVTIMNDPSLSINANLVGLSSQPSKLFCDGQVLFYLANVNNAFVENDIKDMSQEYGVLPLPKLSEDQEFYTNAVHTYHSSTVIVPKNIKKDMLPLISSVLEDMSYYSYLYVKPAYYDTIITYRSIRNDESFEMMPYIFESFNIDLGLIMTDTLGFDAGVRSKITGNDINFSSYFSQYVTLWEKALVGITQNYGGVS